VAAAVSVICLNAWSYFVYGCSFGVWCYAVSVSYTGYYTPL